jgi:hypothetical protein
VAPLEAVRSLVAGIEDAEGRVRSSSETSQVVSGTNGWGGTSACMVKDADYAWVTYTQDWTAAVEYSEPARESLGLLRALGYSSR